ncbi:MAG TPA: HAMP domain-containing sensor histidine kinase [Kofleriaceae bacterium]
MSLRLRLLIVASLAVIALATAIVAVMGLVSDTTSAGFADAAKANDAALAALVSAARPGETRAELTRIARTVLSPTTDMHGGYCWRDGTFVEVASQHAPRHPPFGGPPGRPGDARGLPPGPPPDDGRGPPPGPPPDDERGPPGPPPDDERGPPDDEHGPPAPPPDDERGPPGPPPGARDIGSGARDIGSGGATGGGATGGEGGANPPPDVAAAIAAACKAGVAAKREVVGPAMTTVFQAAPVDGQMTAFAMRMVRELPAQRRWPWSLGVIALATLLVLGLNLHGLWVLRRGARDLSTALATLEADPRAATAAPATPELAVIATGVTRLARRLADEQQERVALERDAAHQKRMSSVGHLVAGISHEVRNPLTGMKLVLDGIKRREADPKTQRDVETVLQEIARLDKLVAATLGVARDTRITLAELDLHVLVDQRIAAAAPTRGITIVRRGEATRVADRDAAVRILDNLLRNAIDASPDGAQIDVAVSPRAIDVIDRGAGVPDAQVAALFEPFVTTKPDGTGLGLWMSLALAEARGGTVRYRRADGMTHFTFELA